MLTCDLGGGEEDSFGSLVGAHCARSQDPSMSDYGTLLSSDGMFCRLRKRR
jgi:hypothetical protein